MTEFQPAIDLDVGQWLNTKAPITLSALRGKVVFIVVFQMLCQGCASTALPQARKVRSTFTAGDLAVIGLHSVFEHHEAQGPVVALQAFLQEYHIDFPVGIDADARPGRLPATMGRYGMQGTPTILLVDHRGRLALNHFGHLDDMALGAIIGSLIAEKNAGQAAG